MTNEQVAAVNDPHFGIEKLAILDSKSSPKPSHGIRFYDFNEPGTWGFCRECRFVVTLAEDGFLVTHERMNGGFSTRRCPGGGKEPDVYYRQELPE